MNATPSSTQGLGLQVQGLRKSFGENEVLRGIDMEVTPGEVFVIMGPSGSGKSVLLRHLIGLEHPEVGEIRVGERSMKDRDALADFRVAYVFQSGALLNSLSVGENVGLYLREHRLKSPTEIERIVREKLALVGLKDVEHHSPANLSGGMRKRVAIARALVVEPQLILYDEPTSELDPLTAVTIGREIRELNHRIGATSIVVTHDRDLAFGIAHRIAIIDQGRILQQGTPEHIRHHPDPFLQTFLNAGSKEHYETVERPR